MYHSTPTLDTKPGYLNKLLAYANDQIVALLQASLCLSFVLAIICCMTQRTHLLPIKTCTPFSVPGSGVNLDPIKRQ